jgi:transposase
MDKKSKNLLKIKLSGLLPELNERQRRLVVGAEALSLGYGGIKTMSEVTGISPPTIRKGIQDLNEKNKTLQRVRKEGGGRKKATEKFPELKSILESIIEPDTRGDPESPLRWTCKSVRNITDLLKKEDLNVSPKTVATILHELEYSLQGNKKTKEGEDHPDRDQQFLYINSTAKKFLKIGSPVISVDTKKKEMVGNYKNPGREWSPKGQPVEVNGHDFPDPNFPKAVPYGIYDIADNKGWVNVGITSDTAEFAVESIRQWWKKMGKTRYPNAKSLVIFADAGGSNGYRSRLWKKELYKFCLEVGFEITVCHFPPGTSKWNKIEHRMFSFISMNWRGKPLDSYQTVVSLIASTKTKSGLIVKARLDKRKYKKGIEVSKKEMDQINLIKHKFHGEWNYSLKPKAKS